MTSPCHFFFFFSSRRRHTRLQGDWSSDVCSSDLWWTHYRSQLAILPELGGSLYQRFADSCGTTNDERSITVKMKLISALIVGFLLAGSLGIAAYGANSRSMPHLQQQGTAIQLIVEGKPFLILAGELGNSTGEPEFLRPYWPKLASLHLNTLL